MLPPLSSIWICHGTLSNHYLLVVANLFLHCLALNLDGYSRLRLLLAKEIILYVLQDGLSRASAVTETWNLEARFIQCAYANLTH
jgi:hypothetical protein